MSPAFSLRDVADRRLGHPKDLGDLSLLHPPLGEERTDLSDVVLGQLRLTVKRADTGRLEPNIASPLPPLPDAVDPVVGSGPDEEMFGADAVWTVAAMQNPQALRDGTDMELPGDAMGAATPTPLAAEDSVAVFVPPPSPYPAAVGLRVDERHEAIAHTNEEPLPGGAVQCTPAQSDGELWGVL